MKCSCCGRKKKIMESFEDIGKGGSVCVECSDLLYRIQDAVAEKDKKTYGEKVGQIKSYIKEKKSMDGFGKWFMDDFMKRNEM